MYALSSSAVLHDNGTRVLVTHYTVPEDCALHSTWSLRRSMGAPFAPLPFHEW